MQFLARAELLDILDSYSITVSANQRRGDAFEVHHRLLFIAYLHDFLVSQIYKIYYNKSIDWKICKTTIARIWLKINFYLTKQIICCHRILSPLFVTGICQRDEFQVHELHSVMNMICIISYVGYRGFDCRGNFVTWLRNCNFSCCRWRCCWLRCCLDVFLKMIFKMVLGSLKKLELSVKEALLTWLYFILD